jgi:putative ABC transport system permease protein
MMIAAQVAISLVLLVGASSLVTSFLKLRSQPPGFNPANLFVGGINLQASRYRDPDAQRRLYVELNDALRSAPGASAAVVTQAVPLIGPYTRAPYANASGGRIPPLNERPLGLTRSVMPGHFATLGIPFLAGRDFTERDTGDAPLVAIVSRATARRLFPDDEVVVGRRIIMGSLGGGQVMEIVGVVGDVRSQTLASLPPVEFYRPAAQRPLPFMRLVVRTRGDAAAFEPTARAILRRIDPQLPLVAVTTAQRVVDQSLAQERLLFMLLAVFAGLAMVLSAIGIYGVVAQYVGQRRVEIAVRIALGARGRTVLVMIVRQSLRPVVAGLASGMLAAGALSPFLQRLLFEVSALSPATMTGAAAGLLTVALAACVLPARRAARIEPTQALKG